MSIRCIFVMFLTQIKQNKVKSVRLINTAQIYLRVGAHFPSNNNIIHRYRSLNYDHEKAQATYIWIDASGENIRLKDRILLSVPNCLADIPQWTCAENSPLQSLRGNSIEIKLIPRVLYRNPFKPGKHDVIVLCDTYNPSGAPFDTNHRCALQITLDKMKEQEPMFAIEQEYTLLDVDGRRFGWPKNGYVERTADCSVGCNRVYARDLSESHSLVCLYAGVDFFGKNSMEILSQWKYQIGPSTGIKAADDLWLSRYILIRIAEEFGICVTFHPKPIKVECSETRAYNKRKDSATEAINRIECHNEKLIQINEPQTIDCMSRINKFSCNTSDTFVRIVVPPWVDESERSFLQDRLLTNMDPYVVCNAILTTTLLDEQ